MIDLRKEFTKLVIDEGLGGLFLLRQPLYDSRGLPYKCRCSVKGEPSPACKNCMGRGTLYYETPVTLYSTFYGSFKDTIPLRVGPVSQNECAFYAIHDYKISKNNIIVVVKLNSDGKIVVPVERLMYYTVNEVEKYSSVKKVEEYWKIYASENTIYERQAPGRK